MKKGKKIIVFLIAMILSIINIGVVKADTKNIEVTNIAVKDKSGTITVVDPVLSSNEITSNITFNKVDDFVTFELKIKNNELEKYKIESITDNNTNENITIQYSFNEDYIKTNETSTVTIKLTYKNKLKNVEKINLNNLVITLNLVNEQGEGTSVVVNNPTTGDNILMYLLFLILALSGIIFIIKRTRVKRLKIGTLVVLVSILILPFAILALEKYEVKIKFTDIEIKGEFETYNITIDPKNGETPVTKAITYGDSIGELSESPSKEGYTFDKWVDSDGNTVTEDTVITGPIEIEAKYKVKEYTITYNLDGGTVTGNPEKYTIESNDITLKNPRKTGYTFTGWTGTGIDTKTTSVTIENGSTGNRSYTANYSANEDTEYTVTHRYQKLDGTYEEVVVTEYGETDKEVNAPIQSRTGFENPRVQQVTINADGSSSVTYTYTRTNYNFSITDRTYIDSTSTSNGEYPYETEITVKATERKGYTFKWSDNDTNYERTFKLKDNKELTPIYTANTDTRYVVKHYKMNLDGTTYSLADTQNLTGTTDSEVTPSVNDYEGFTSPSTQTVTIKGDGTTEVEYQYTRNKYTLTLEDSEYIETTATTGEYYYGETITLKAKEKDGYTFEKWSNDSPNEEIELTITGNITIKPIYTANTYTVIFNSNGGGEVSSITVDAGESIQSFTTPTAPSGKVFDGWWTELNEGTKVNTPYTPEGNITLYAHWNNNPFSLVFSHEGECTFNGKNGVLTGDNCAFANGINKFIDTGVNLYNSENHDKDYEIGFTIVSYSLDNQDSQATFMNTKYEANNYPGIVFRRRTGNTTYDLSSRKTTSANETKYFEYGTINKVKIYRIYNSEKDVQEIFYSINDEEKVLFNDLSKFNPEFDLSVWFGASPANAEATTAQRYLTGTLSDMYIKLGSYQEEESTEYTVRLNPNGGSVSPTSKKVNIGDQIGTLPTPTAPSGKSFTGWFTGLTDGVEVTSSYTPTSNLTIYARYYTDVTGTTVSPSSISILNGGNETITVSNVEEEYTFTSNNTNVATVDSTGKVTGTGVGTTTITITGSTSGKTRTINVTVEPSSYTVTLNANGGSVNPTSITVNNGDSVGTLPEPTPPTNKVFDGWYTELTGGVKVTSSYVPNNNITIYARYKNPTYTISFDAGEGSAVNDIEVEQGNSIGTLPTSTRNGYILEGWYEENTYETKVTSSTIPTGNVTYYAKWEKLEVCADNENITRLSENTCSNNENITVGDGIVCKRAVKLHEETCSRTDTTSYCSGTGYTESGSKGTSTITYGSCGTSGTLTSGDAFTCDVNGDEKFDELTERFYYVSDYYDTSAKEFDDSTAVLIYYNNVTSGVSCNKNTFAYDSSKENWHGPRTLVSQLPTTSQWSNVSLKSEKRAILAENQSTHDSPTTNGRTLPTDFSYEGYAARFLTAKELMAGCNLIEVGRRTTGELDSCNYIMENTKYAKSTIGSTGTWLETPSRADSYSVWYAGGYYLSVRSSSTNNTSFGGARPAIEVPKNKIEYGASSAYTVTLNANGGSVNPTSITVNIGDAIGTLPTPTAPTGKSFTGWYTDLTGGIEVTSTYIPNTDIEIYAHFEELKVCADNENITRLSENTCSNNENITVGDGIVCKRAIKLHEETCSQIDETYYCSGAGYANDSTITYGSCGTSGTLTSGDAFTCDVNGDEKFDELTERFYYVSDYYNTSTKDFESDTAVLIYYNNVTNGVSCNKKTYAYDASDKSYKGPVSLLNQLPTTLQWNNINLKNNTRDILAEYVTYHDLEMIGGTPLKKNFSYEGYSARFLAAKELMFACNLESIGSFSNQVNSLNSCNYFMENSSYSILDFGTTGFWLETPSSAGANVAWSTNGKIRDLGKLGAVTKSTKYYGARPAIEVLKSKISY